MEILALFTLFASAVAIGVCGMVATSEAMSPLRSRASRIACAAIAFSGIGISVFALAACFLYSIGV